jgi:1,4-dihydroxy-2-naphthoyl-CoA hydrolase
MELEPFAYEFRVRLHDTDAAGVLFFGHLFRHLHDAYESFMGSIGFPLPELIAPPATVAPVALPIVHAEADYARPLRHGDTIRVHLTVAEVRTRSFALDYRLEDQGGQHCASARTVHILRASDAADPPRLPERLRLALLARVGGEPLPPDRSDEGPD